MTGRQAISYDDRLHIVGVTINRRRGEKPAVPGATLEEPRMAATAGDIVSAPFTPEVKRYRLVLFLSIVANLSVGIFILFWPDEFADVAGQPHASPDTWPRHWGMQLWAINLLYLPGYWNPRDNRWPNWVGIGVRFTFSAFFFLRGDGFVPMGIYDGLSGLALLLTYLPAVKRKG